MIISGMIDGCAETSLIHINIKYNLVTVRTQLSVTGIVVKLTPLDVRIISSLTKVVNQSIKVLNLGLL